MPRKIDVLQSLPLSLPPRGLAREQAAIYIGVSATKFHELVKDGRMPKPKEIDGRRVWDRLALDAAFSALPDDDDRANANGEVWDRPAV